MDRVARRVPAPTHTLALILFTLWLGQRAEEAAPVPPPIQASPPAQSATVDAAGWRVYVDPESGEIRSQPSAAQRAALEQLLGIEPATDNRSSVGLVTFPLALGGVGVNLQGRFAVSTHVHLHADGSTWLSCSDHAAPGRPAAPLAPPLRVEER